MSCTLNADLDLPVLKKQGRRARTTLDEIVRAAIAPQFTTIANAHMTFVSPTSAAVCLIDKDEAMLPESATAARVFTAMPSRPSTSTPASVIGALKLRGCVSGLAFVPSKSSIGAAKLALKTDLLRTLWARCSAVCDTLDDDLQNYELKTDASGGDEPTDANTKPKMTSSGAAVPNSTVALPIRLRVPFADTLFLSDYVAVEDDTETYTDSIERMAAIFGKWVTDISRCRVLNLCYKRSLKQSTPCRM